MKAREGVTARWLKDHVEPGRGTLGYAYPVPSSWGSYWDGAWVFVTSDGAAAYPGEPGVDFVLLEGVTQHERADNGRN